MSVDQMSVDQMSVDQMSVDKLVGKIDSWSRYIQNFLQL